MLDDIITRIKTTRMRGVDVNDALRAEVKAQLRAATNAQMAALVMRVVDAVVCPVDEANKQDNYKGKGVMWSTPQVNGESVDMHPMHITEENPLGKGTFLVLYKQGGDRSGLAIKAPLTKRRSFDLCDVVASFPTGGLTIHELDADMGHPAPDVRTETVCDMIVLLLETSDVYSTRVRGGFVDVGAK